MCYKILEYSYGLIGFNILFYDLFPSLIRIFVIIGISYYNIFVRIRFIRI